MNVCTTIQDTKNYLNFRRKEEKTIGFVPTMGALHQGHISLLERCKKENDIAVASIFVNPLQFNDKKDLENYPRTLETDSEKLKAAGCNMLFAPSVEEMYGKNPMLPSEHPESFFDLGGLDLFMEGAHRPGHFQGVCTAVKKLFGIIQPRKAYFGEKDFQQLAIIKHMVKMLKIPVEITGCPTVREEDGLAISSRNRVLTPEERKNAPLIYKTLLGTKATGGTLVQIRTWVEDQINSSRFMKLEYFEVVNAGTLHPLSNEEFHHARLSAPEGLQACIAVKMGSVRLIDNIPF
ncbi:MAG: pantoate--beta-alanine ligase [Bacteroidetes bacterium]|nr:pantoate--beta-alanine ligase [Bacteroidota bacterium]